MQRSGNHAFLSWIHANSPSESYIFLNNCEPYRNPFETFCQIEIDGNIIRGSKVKRLSFNSFLQLARKNLTFTISYENYPPQLTTNNNCISTGIDDNFFDLQFMIVRSFLNWLASLSVLYRLPELNRGAKKDRTEKKIEVAVDSYFNFLDLMTSPNLPCGLHCIVYDEWALNEKFRIELLEKIGFLCRKVFISEIPPYGRGSSFSDNHRHENIDCVCQRWQTLRDDIRNLPIIKSVQENRNYMEKLNKVFPKDVERIELILS